MAEEMEVMDVEQIETGTEGEVEQQEGAEQKETQQEDPYSSKASREYSQWLKSLRESGDPQAQKFARLAKNNHGEMFALRQLDKDGINGVREKYALLDSIIHHDPERGELKGQEAIAALQDSVREYAEIDELLASGDPRALDSLGEDFNGGLAKLTPAILDRVATADPEAYVAAVLPHFVKALAESDLVSNFNGLVDVLNEVPPTWLTAEQKTAWQADQQRKVIALAGNMGKWLNAQAAKAGELSKSEQGKQGTRKVDPLSQREAEFNKREQEAHWSTNIAPKLDKHAGVKFAELFRPYAKRLNLDVPTTNALKMEFSRRVAGEAAKDKNYIRQIGRYRAMSNPDPSTVFNFAKVQFDKNAKIVMDALVNERYKPFLNGKPRVATQTNGNGKSAPPPPAKGIQYVTTRPAEGTYDPKARTLDQIHAKIFPLKNGKIVQVRA
jgi:hypothetical protein